jgi:hypothetical protein
MNCSLCESSNQAEYPAEVALHFTSRENLYKPGRFYISEGSRLLGLRLFAFYHPRNRVASTQRRNRLTVEIRWDEKAGLRRDAIRSQVIDARSKAQEIKETGNEED